MKKILLLSSVLLGAIPASQAGIHFGIGIDLPLPVPPPLVISRPPVVVVHPAPPVVCAPVAPVVVAPPVVCAPRAYYPYYYPYPRGHYYYGHRGFYGRH